MRKILFFMLLLVQLTAATAFAYTNKEDGFKTQSPSSANYVEANIFTVLLTITVLQQGIPNV